VAPARTRLLALALGLLALALGLLAAAAPTRASGGLSAQQLFGAPSIREVLISPSGRYLAAVASTSHANFVLVRETERGHPVVALRKKREIVDLSWVDGDELVVSLEGDRDLDFHRISIQAVGDELTTEEKWIATRGWLADPLPNVEGTVLWARFDGSRTEVYRAPLAELALGRGAPSSRHRVAEMRGRVPWWIADRSGVVRGALRVEDESPPTAELFYRESADAPWRSLFRSTDPDRGRRPVGIASNGRDLLVLSNESRDTWALYELDVATGKLGRELFAHPDLDVVRIKYDYSGTEIIGAVVLEAGLPSYHYFDAFAARHQRSLEHALPGRAVVITSASADGRYLAVVAWGPREPGTYYVLDTTTREAREVGRRIDGLEASDLADVEAFQVQSADGRRIDAFLARPLRPSGTPPPLVVWPHGGPIGVADQRAFDPWIQYLADAGMAVLQVNYRGSGGYGKSFLDAGRREWAQGIEDDIDAAVDRVVSQGLVDPGRIGIAGWSYGGYSALISAVRSPERYRCAASIAGPTDLPLIFQSSDFAASEEGRRRFAEIVGDPERDHDRLLEISPAYRAAEIRIPVLLGHGSEDRRVDVEHLYRMHVMLSELGKPHEWFVVDGAEHSPSPEQAIEFAQRLRAFLARHLAASWRAGG
jgi:dipeptidyl aminopeptidase/acylaminoacyl peptidase